MSETEVQGSIAVSVTDSYSKELAILAAKAAFNKKASNPKVLELGDLIGITDYFVVCSAANARQIKTIVDEIEMSVRASTGLKPRAVEGLSDATWVLVDYGDIVVHIMSEEARAFYSLERLWSDALLIDWENVA